MVNVTESLDPVAFTEPYQAAFAPHMAHVKLRVLSGFDVGLVICGLFSAMFMELR